MRGLTRNTHDPSGRLWDSLLVDVELSITSVRRVELEKGLRAQQRADEIRDDVLARLVCGGLGEGLHGDVAGCVDEEGWEDVAVCGVGCDLAEGGGYRALVGDVAFYCCYFFGGFGLEDGLEY